MPKKPVKTTRSILEDTVRLIEYLRRIRKIGCKRWKQESNYHRRSLVETTVFRFKMIFGDRIQTRKVENQVKELLLKTSILSQMTHLGMPDSYKVIG